MNSQSKERRNRGGRHLAQSKLYIPPVDPQDRTELMEEKLLDAEQNLDRQYRIKKLANLIVSFVIVVLGISSVIFIFHHDKEGWLTLRWLTVDGTIFTTALSVVFVIFDVMDFLHLTEHAGPNVYFMRLTSAVAEGLIMLVVLISQLPFFSEHMHIFRFDMFNMHILIPILMTASFIVNDSPPGVLSFRQKWNGTWYVTIYAAVIITLIITGVISTELIPYFFLDVTHLPLLDLAAYFIGIYGIAFFLSCALSYLNRKVSWLWLHDLDRRI